MTAVINSLFLAPGKIEVKWSEVILTLINLTIIMCFDRHNFYVFPRLEALIDGPSYEFLWQTTSIEFLAKYQFDFNACIREGSLSCLCFGLDCIGPLANYYDIVVVARGFLFDL